MSTPQLSSSVQEASIGVAFNSQMLGNLLMGIYAMVYLGTLYIYVSKETSKNWLVMGSISLSYVAFVISNSVLWYLNKIAFVDKGTSREDIFIAIYFGPEWATFVSDICSFLIAALADGLLIWRCFNIWNHSFRAILLSSFLLFCEIAVDLSIMIIEPTVDFTFSVAQTNVLAKLIGTSLFVTFTTTLVTTVLIAYRIHSFSRRDVLRSSRTRFGHIVDILVQSAALYCVATLAYAIIGIIQPTASNFQITDAINSYGTPVYIFITGVAPTIMVARVALATERNDRISPISGLRFRSTASNSIPLEWETSEREI